MPTACKIKQQAYLRCGRHRTAWWHPCQRFSTRSSTRVQKKGDVKRNQSLFIEMQNYTHPHCLHTSASSFFLTFGQSSPHRKKNRARLFFTFLRSFYSNPRRFFHTLCWPLLFPLVYLSTGVVFKEVGDIVHLIVNNDPAVVLSIHDNKRQGIRVID